MADYIAIDKVIPDEEYDSIPLDDESLIELANDIQMQGQIQSIVVNSDWEIVDGRRRLKAVKEILKYGKIQYTVKDVKGDYKTLASLSANIHAHRFTTLQLADKIRQMTALMKKLYPAMFETGPKDSEIMSSIGKRPVVQAAEATGKTVRTFERLVHILDNIKRDDLRDVLIQKEIKQKDIEIISEWGKDHQEKIAELLQDKERKYQILNAMEEGATALWQTVYPLEKREPKKHIERPIIDATLVESPVCLSELGLFEYRIRRMPEMAKKGITWDSIYVGYMPDNAEYIFVKYLPYEVETGFGKTLTQAQFAHWAIMERIIKDDKRFRGENVNTFSVENNDRVGGRIIWNGIAIPKHREQAAILGKKRRGSNE
jgi:ParB-like chromosome segregation protein Spo0J